MEKITVIGLGRMGSAIALRCQEKGHQVTGWTRSGRALEGVKNAPDLVEAVAAGDVLILSLYDDAAVTEVLDQLLTLPLQGKLIIDTSTVLPTLLTSRAAEIAAAGAAAVDAPIAGGPEMVAAGTCGVFVGGDDAAAARAEAALSAISSRIFHVGPLGTGLVMKTLNNAMLQVYVQGLSELLPLAKRAGLPLKTALDILSGGPAGLPMVRDRIPKILGEDTEVGFPLTAISKDNDVFQAVLAAYDLTSPILQLAAARQDKAIAEGLGDKDPASLIADAYAKG